MYNVQDLLERFEDAVAALESIADSLNTLANCVVDEKFTVRGQIETENL